MSLHIPESTLFDAIPVDLRAAEREPILERLKWLRPHTLLCTRPHVNLTKALTRTAGGLYRPKQADRITNEFMIACTILRCGSPVIDGLAPGVTILAPQFSGGIIYDLDETGCETSLWLLGDSQVLAILENE